MRRRISVLTERRLARIRFFSVTRPTRKRPVLVLTHACVSPRNPNVSGFPSPRLRRLAAAKRAELDQARLVGMQPEPKARETGRADSDRKARRRLDIESPPRSRPAYRTRTTSPLACRLLHWCATDQRRNAGRHWRAGATPSLPAARPRPAASMIRPPTRPRPAISRSAQDPSIRDTVLQQPTKPRLVKAPEVVANVGVQHPS